MSRARFLFAFATALIAIALSPRLARAQAISVEGSVAGMTSVTQMTAIAGFDQFEGDVADPIAPDRDASQGMLWGEGDLQTIFPGIEAQGDAFFGSLADPANWNGYFYLPTGDVAQNGLFYFGDALLLPTTNVTQFGLVANAYFNIHLTAFDANGALLGQVDWLAESEAGFVGIDTLGVPIGAVAISGSDLWDGEVFGSTTQSMSDGWVWGAGGAAASCNVDADCSDGTVCDGIETCSQTTHTCVLGAWFDCTDAAYCSLGVCDAVQGCVVVADDINFCDDGNGCSFDDHCEGGVCVGTTNCATNDPCNVGVCESGECVYSFVDGAACDDGNPCTDLDTCQSGGCFGLVPTSCDDDNPCTTDVCDEVYGCVHTIGFGTCDDENACTRNDFCEAGECTGEAIDCDDANPCTTDACDRDRGCVHEAVKHCVACAVGDNVELCDDGDVCTSDTCGASSCEHAPIAGCCHAPSDCDDGQTCEANECSGPSDSGGCAMSGRDASTNAGPLALLALFFFVRRCRGRRSSGDLPRTPI